MMRVLGIDCGSRSTGFGIIESDDEEHRVITFGVIQFPAADAFSQRLLKIHTEIRNLIVTHSPSATAIEDQFYLSNFKSVMKLGQVKGVAILSAAGAGIPVFEYSPMQVKSAVTGYGRAEKNQVQVMVKNILKLADLPRPDDAADALALAICHIHTMATRRRLRLADHPISAHPKGSLL
jgi:crossover junction endodeoxyribonuclease RuvC